MRDKKETRKPLKIKTMVAVRLANREPSPVPKTGNIKASVGPQAWEKKTAKKDSQIKATAGP
eukprot:11178790-Ditylum_brightwellii.AAC.1